jgi:K+:H+ antiporter
MELVILSIGLDIKVISPALFSMMVMMALVTTFMTTPILVAVTGNSMPAEAVAIDENRERLLLSARKAEGL